MTHDPARTPHGVFVRPIAAMLTMALAGGAIPAHAAPGGFLHTLLKGMWVCETMGDAEEAPTRLVKDSFRIIPDSSYVSATGQSGTYLLLGNNLVMTTGPFRARKYILVGQSILHPVDNQGKRTTDRCVQQSTASVLENSQDAG